MNKTEIKEQIGKFLRYSIASVTSFVIDIALFTVFCHLLKSWNSVLYAAVATVFARIISGTYNYLVNYKFVFKSTEKKLTSAGKYVALALAQMGCSALLVTLAIHLFAGVNESILKIVVDCTLFFVSYVIQKKFVF